METSKGERASPPRRAWVVPFVIVGVLVLLAPIALAIANSGDDTDTASSSATSSTSSTSSTSTTTVAVVVETTTSIFDASTTSTSALTVTPTPTTVAAANCRNSTSASCGAFRWDPQPGANRPITIEVQWDNSVPRVGEEVIFNVTVADPDATPIKEGACGNGNGMSFGDGAAIPTSCNTPCSAARYGPWTPPATARGAATFAYRHVYSSPGTYSPRVAFASGDRCNPYASVNHLTFTITVTE